MKIFNSIHNYEVSCYLEILYKLSSTKDALSLDQIQSIIQKYSLVGFDHTKRVLNFLEQCGLITEIEKDRRYRLSEANPASVLPFITYLELDYLCYILESPLAQLFLSPKLYEKLVNEFQSPRRQLIDSNYIIDLKSIYSIKHNLSPNEFRTVLQAIEEQRRIKYHYVTKHSSQELFAEAIPYRIEYSDNDGRWWLLLYDECKQRPIKAILENLHHIELSSKHYFSEKEIEASLKKLQAKQSILLRVHNQKNALQRCFSLFEQQERLSVKKIAPNEYHLEILYYKFEQKEILKKLLYLGNQVILEKPKDLQNEYLQNLKNIFNKYMPKEIN